MRFSLAVAVVLVGISVSGLAQQNKFKVKASPPERAAKSSDVPLKTGATTPASADAKNLQALERKNSKVPGAQASGKKTAPALKPIKDRPNPPINLGGSGGGKSTGATSKTSNAYKGRLKQKGGGHSR